MTITDEQPNQSNTCNAEGTAIDDAVPAQAALSTDDLGTFSLSDLMEYEMPPQRWAIEGLLPTGLTLLAGRPKFGKSWLGYDSCLAIPVGGTVLGHQAVQGTALYLALEDTTRRLQDRAQKLLGGRPAPAGLRICNEWRRWDMGGREDLERFLDTYRDTRLVVIDIGKRIAPPHLGKSTQYAYDYELVSELKQLADKHGIAVVVVLHTTKFTDDDDPFIEISGSTGTTGAADTMIVLRQHKAGKYKEFCIRGRDVSDERFPITFDEDTCRWMLASEDGDPFAALGLTPEQHDVASVLWLSDGIVQPKEVAEDCEMSVTAAQKHLLHLADLGVADKVSYGKYCLSEQYRVDRNADDESPTTAPVASTLPPTLPPRLRPLPRRGGKVATRAFHAA